MIDCYTWPTPNGHKVHIMLEECGTPYNVIPINIGEGDQFKPDFLKISPNNKMPAIVDNDGPGGEPISVFETGAILLYLGRKTGQFLPDEAVDGILERTGAEDGDLVFFGADKRTVVNDSLSALREQLGKDRGLVADGWAPLWVVDFPMFLDDGEGGWDAVHHPFTRPSGVTPDELERIEGTYGLVSMCCGGGLGTGTIIERI